MPEEQPHPDTGLRALFGDLNTYTLGHLAATLHYVMADKEVNTLLVFEEERVGLCDQLSTRDDTSVVSGPTTKKRGLVGDQGLYLNTNTEHILIDNFDSFNPDYTILREPLEHRRLTITDIDGREKSKIHSNTLAVSPPKYGRFDDCETHSNQNPIPQSIRISFDLVLCCPNRPIKTTSTSRKSDGFFNEAHSLEPTPTEKAVQQIEKLREVIQHHVSIPKSDSPDPMFLAQSYSRLRLSNSVEQTDVNRVKKHMGLLGIDPETGELDADRVKSGTSTAQRERIRIVQSALQDLAGEEEKTGVGYDLLLDTVQQHDMEESTLKDILQKLRDGGDIYKPSHDRYEMLE